MVNNEYYLDSLVEIFLNDSSVDLEALIVERYQMLGTPDQLKEASYWDEVVDYFA